MCETPQRGTWKLKALNPTLPVATCLVDRSKAFSCPLFFDFVCSPIQKPPRRIWIQTGVRPLCAPGQRIFDGIHTSPLSAFSARCMYNAFEANMHFKTSSVSNLIRFSRYLRSEDAFLILRSTKFSSISGFASLFQNSNNYYILLFFF